MIVSVLISFIFFSFFPNGINEIVESHRKDGYRESGGLFLCTSALLGIIHQGEIRKMRKVEGKR